MQFTPVLIIVLAAYALLQLYMSIRVVHYTNAIFKSKLIAALFLLIWLALAATPVLGTLLKAESWKYLCMRVGNIWLGVVLIAAVIIIVMHLICEIISKDDDLGRVAAAIIFFGALAISAGLNVYGTIQSHEIVKTQYDVVIDDSTTAPKEIRIAYVSDLHLGVDSKTTHIRDMVTAINESDPDVVIIGGDIFNGDYVGIKYPDRFISELSKIEARYGVYGVYGNHDVESDTFAGILVTPESQTVRGAEMEAFIKEVGWTMLEDGQVILPNGVRLVGRMSNGRTGKPGIIRKNAERILSNVNASDSCVVIEYEPYGLNELAEEGADLILCGQTHNGQVVPVNYALKYLSPNSYGMKEVDGAYVITSSGVGTFGPPIRLGTVSEVVIANVTFK